MTLKIKLRIVFMYKKSYLIFGILIILLFTLGYFVFFGMPFSWFAQDSNLEAYKIGSTTGIEPDGKIRTYNDSQKTSILFAYPENWGEVKSYRGGSGPNPDENILYHGLYFINQPLEKELTSTILFRNGDPLGCNNTITEKCTIVSQNKNLKKSILIGSLHSPEAEYHGDVDINTIQFRWEIDNPTTHPLGWDKLYFIIEYKNPNDITAENINAILEKTKALDLESPHVLEFINNFESYIVQGFSFHPLVVVNFPKYNAQVDASQSIIVEGQARHIFKDGKFNIYAAYTQPNWIPSEGPDRIIDQYTVNCSTDNSACDENSESFVEFKAIFDLSSSPRCYVSILFLPGDKTISSSSDLILRHNLLLKGIPQCK